MIQCLLQPLLEPFCTLEPLAGTLLEPPSSDGTPFQRTLPADPSSAGTPFCAFLAPFQQTLLVMEPLPADPSSVGTPSSTPPP